MSIIIKGNAFLNGEIIENVSIIVNDEGIIDKVVKGTTKLKTTYDFTGNKQVVLPGMVDIHVHMRDFEESYKEDFYTGTSAAAAGGVTVICDMPNTKPPTDSFERLMLRDRVASEKAIVDYGLYVGVPSTMKGAGQLEKIAVGVKIYPKDLKSENLRKFLAKIGGDKNFLTIFHAEDPDLIRNNIRPLEAEISGVKKALAYVSKYNVKAHITHVTNHIIVDYVKSSTRGVTVDTCPHYLILSTDSVSGNRYFRVNPPLRSEDLRKKLFDYLREGKIDAIVTDHAPHTLEEKLGENPKPGFPGLETALPILLTFAVEKQIRLGDVVKLYSENPAKIIGLHKYVGSLASGKYANLVVVKLNEEYVIDPEKFFSKAKHSPFRGFKVKGKVIATFVRGKPVFINDEVVGKRGYGINIKRYGERIC